MNMIKTCFAILSLLFCLPSGIHSQYFEGTVSYKVQCKSKIPETMSDEELSKITGDRMVYSLKKGNYRFDYSGGQLMGWMLRRQGSDTMYSRYMSSDTVFIRDIQVPDDTILSTEMHKNVTTVLGYPCDVITFITTSGRHSWYFNTAFPVDAGSFKNHRFSQLHRYLSMSHALPLKETMESEYGIFTCTAISIKKGKLNDNIFLPPRDPILKQQ
jgi:hypothetical protein